MSSNDDTHVSMGPLAGLSVLLIAMLIDGAVKKRTVLATIDGALLEVNKHGPERMVPIREMLNSLRETAANFPDDDKAPDHAGT